MTTCLPSNRLAFCAQETTALPSTITVQAPQEPSGAQPSLTDRTPSSSRRSSSRLVLSPGSADTDFPLRVNSMASASFRYSIAPSTSEISAIRMTTPLNASDQYRACRVPSTSSGSSSMRGRLWRTIDSGFARSRSSSRVTR